MFLRGKTRFSEGVPPLRKLSEALFPSRTGLFPLGNTSERINMRQEASSFHEILLAKLERKTSTRPSSSNPLFSDEFPSWIFEIPETPRHTWPSPRRFTSYKTTQPPQAPTPEQTPSQKIILERQFRAVDLKDQALQGFLFLEAHGNLSKVFTLKELKGCFRNLAKNHHPDKNLNHENLYIQIREAYENVLQSLTDL